MKNKFILAAVLLSFFLLKEVANIALEKITISSHPPSAKMDTATPTKWLARNVVSKSTTEATSFTFAQDLRDSDLPKNERDALCQLKRLDTTVPSGTLSYFRVDFPEDEHGPMGTRVMIKDPGCPPGKFSVIEMDLSGALKNEIDCTSTTLTELMLTAQDQGDIDTKGAERDWVAIRGPGFFTMQCPNGLRVLSRDGRFKKSLSHHLIDSNGCTALNTNGFPVVAQGKLGTEGCFENFDCIATIDPSTDVVHGIRRLNSYSFLLDRPTWPSHTITRAEQTSLVAAAFEDLYDPRREPAGISWEGSTILDLEKLDCPMPDSAVAGF